MSSIFIDILTVLEVIICLLLSLIVLMQKPRQEGLGAAFGSGMMDQFAGAQTTNFLQRWTVYFGVALFAFTFLLAVLIARQDQHKSGGTLVDQSEVSKAQAAKAEAEKAEAGKTPQTAAQAVQDIKAAAAAKTTSEKQEAKPASPTPAPAAQKPSDAKPAAPKPATPAASAPTKPAETKPSPAPQQQKPTDATPPPAPAPANK